MRSERGYDLRARHEHQLEDNEIDQFKQVDISLARAIGERLNHWYPGHPWYVETSHAGGIAKISIPMVMGAVNCYVLHINDLKSDPSFGSVMKAGGEILERYKMPRAGFDASDFIAATTKHAPIGRPRNLDSVPQ